MPRLPVALAALAATCGGAVVADSVSTSFASPRPHSAVGTIVLTCAESAGQQGRGGEVVVGGVEGLKLAASSHFSALGPVRGPGGKRYFVVKDFLAVSAAAAPYATVTIVSPRSASLFYGRSGSSFGLALVAASRRSVRLPVCGPRFTGYVGGFVVTGPTTVTFSVTSPHLVTQRVTVPIGLR